MNKAIKENPPSQKFLKDNRKVRAYERDLSDIAWYITRSKENLATTIAKITRLAILGDLNAVKYESQFIPGLVDEIQKYELEAKLTQERIEQRQSK